MDLLKPVVLRAVAGRRRESLALEQKLPGVYLLLVEMRILVWTFAGHVFTGDWMHNTLSLEANFDSAFISRCTATSKSFQRQ